ncbi:MAG: cation-transporting P-type ATPase [Mycobacterium sp.]
MVSKHAEVSEVPRVVELGLTSDQTARLLTERGPNRLPVQHPTPWWRRLAAEMVHFFALLFWVAGGLAFVAGLDPAFRGNPVPAVALSPSARHDRRLPRLASRVGLASWSGSAADTNHSC